MTLTVDDRELIELIESLQKRTEWRDEFSAGTRDLFEEAADRLQSLLSERDKLREVLRELIVSPSPDAFRNARAALTQTEVP